MLLGFKWISWLMCVGICVLDIVIWKYCEQLNALNSLNVIYQFMSNFIICT